MSPEYQIAALWVSGSLSYLEQLCLVSFRDAGHHVRLYTYDEVGNIPEGIEVADANEVLSMDNVMVHKRTGSPALHSDVFRYKLLEQNDRTIWADTDAYCVKRFEPVDGHFYGWESDSHINGGVLALPADSDTLGELLTLTEDEFAIPSWYGKEYENELIAKRDAGNPVPAGEQPWGVWGPHAITHFLHKTGEVRYALPRVALYPFTFKERRKMLKPDTDVQAYVTPETYSVHLYGRRMRARLVEREGGIPHPQSLIGQLLKKHKIDPGAAPIIRKAPEPEVAPAASEPLPTSARYGRGQLNLTDLADKYGSDKGSSKHRYTELYNMLFQPFRHRKIRFLEMGLQIGGPEHGKSADRETTDLPSVRMWLEYFTKAEIVGLDISDFSWFEADRFSFIRCDMDKREYIDAALKDVADFDIIIDDASHASHHQQNAFLSLFPKLKSGGLYIIEDLRWQPKAYERSDISKTAEVFQSYLSTGVFSNADENIAAEMNTLRADISGCFVFQAKYQKKRRDQVVVVHKR